MSGSALEGGAIFEGEVQAAIRVGRGVVQQAAPELFAEGGDLAVLLFQDSEEVFHRTAPVPDVADLLRDCVLLGLGRLELLAECIEALVVLCLVLSDRSVLPDHLLDHAVDIACGSGGMFVQSGDFVNSKGMSANKAMTFYGQEKVDYNAKLCLMNIAVHGLTGVIKSGEEANSFYNDAHNLVGCCDYVMANPPFNVDKVKAEAAQNAGRLPFGLPSVNKAGEIGNANYLSVH